ncbi:MAG: winged helix-turn-helix domain-containing protein, partial [Thermofilaceae archaeon]
MILGVLASSRVPLSAREIARRCGLPGRTVRYYLRQLRVAGLVEALGSRPFTVYRLTREGAAVYAGLRLGVGVPGFGVGKLDGCARVGGVGVSVSYGCSGGSSAGAAGG